MVANIPGARLRDTERELAMLRGEQAVTAFLESHPNETKVLQQMVEMRRAGKPAPSLARVQRAMLWSDGSLEFNTAPAPEGSRGRGASPDVRDRSGRGAGRGDRGPRSDRGATSPGAARPMSGGDRSAPVRFSGRPPGGDARAGGRPVGAGRDTGVFTTSRSGESGVGSRRSGGVVGGRPGGVAGSRSGTGRQGYGGRRDRGEDDASARGVPRSGEGWTLYRAGERPEVEDPVEYAVNGPAGGEEETADTQDVQSTVADAQSIMTEAGMTGAGTEHRVGTASE
jgi:hypothetical protein